MREHGAALERMLRNPPDNPVAALEATLAPMSPNQRRTALLAVIQSHGAGLLGTLEEPRRSNTVVSLVSGLGLEERLPVLVALVAWAVRSGDMLPMLSSILATAKDKELIDMLRRLVASSAGRLQEVERRVLSDELCSILHVPLQAQTGRGIGGQGAVGTLDGTREEAEEARRAQFIDSNDMYVGLRQRALHCDMDRLGLLKEAGVQTFALPQSKDEIAAKHEAQRAKAEARRLKAELEEALKQNEELRSAAAAASLSAAMAKKKLEAEGISFAQQRSTLEHQLQQLSGQVEALTAEGEKLRVGWQATAAELDATREELRETTERLTHDIEEQKSRTAEAEKGWAAATDAAKEAAHFASEAARAAASVQSGTAPRWRAHSAKSKQAAEKLVPALDSYKQASNLIRPLTQEIHNAVQTPAPRPQPAPVEVEDAVALPTSTPWQSTPEQPESQTVRFRHVVADEARVASDGDMGADADSGDVDDADRDPSMEAESRVGSTLNESRGRSRKGGSWRASTAQVDDGLEPETDEDEWPALEWADSEECIDGEKSGGKTADEDEDAGAEEEEFAEEAEN